MVSTVFIIDFLSFWFCCPIMEFLRCSLTLKRKRWTLRWPSSFAGVLPPKNMPFYQPSTVFLAYPNYLFPDFQCHFSALTDISKSIALYLHDEKSIYRVLAVDLCSRGFHVWQHYIDSMEILRSLFNLSTNMDKDSISVQNVGAQARLAVLAIAGNSMPLLMGTMCLDILTPPSVEHRRSVLQILAYLIRKVLRFFDSNKTWSVWNSS